MIYWLILFLVIVGLFFGKKNSNFCFKAAFYLLAGGVLLRVIGLSIIGEFLLRVDLVFWLVSFVLVIKENKYED